MNLKTIYNKITGDIRAVSPVVATLVLIVVAIVGAAAVGTMTGVFTEDVGRQNASVRPIYSESLIVGGSTGVEPVAREIARGFMAANPTVRVTVQTGGSGAGIRAIGMNTIDIGMASRPVRSDEFERFPAIVSRVVRIGNSTVLLIANPSVNMAYLNNATHAELNTLFRTGAITGNLTNATVLRGVHRLDRTGTGDVFLESVVRGTPAVTHDTVHANILRATGNSGVFDMIRTTTGAIGGVDIGFAAAGVNRTEATHLRVSRALQFITYGEPSRLEQAFLDYARSPEARAHFQTVGAESLHDLPLAQI